MSIESICFVGAFLGSMFGLPGGVLIIQVIKLVVAKFESRNDKETELLEWSITQPGCVIIDETQIAGNWVRTFDISNLKAVDDNGDEIPMKTGCEGYVTQIVGSIGASALSAQTRQAALDNHKAAVKAVRGHFGLK